MQLSQKRWRCTGGGGGVKPERTTGERTAVPRALLHDIEIDLIALESVGALEVGRELTAQLSLRGEGPLGQVQ
jgi:hypothetical protein